MTTLGLEALPSAYGWMAAEEERCLQYYFCPTVSWQSAHLTKPASLDPSLNLPRAFAGALSWLSPEGTGGLL